ncbi:MAG TPA: alpha/beta hydrolase [Mizugakiibacter sp.]
MYYEIEGTGRPLVYIPHVFGFAGLQAFPALLQSHALITVDLQGHGRTADIPERPLSLEQHAEDVVGLLRHLGIPQADFFGASYGGGIATLIAVRHPDMAGRVATYGATFGPPEVAHNLEMLRFDEPPTPDSGAFRFKREGYRKVAPDPDYWPRIWDKVVAMRWEGFSKEELASIASPFLIALGDHDFVRLEHALDAFRRIPHAELAVIPDTGHFAPLSEPEKVIPVIQHFLEKPPQRLPLATAGMGYNPGETR